MTSAFYRKQEERYARLAAEAEAAEAVYPIDDPYPIGTVLQYEAQMTNASYTYVVLKGRNGLWYTTGQSEKARTWAALRTWLIRYGTPELVELTPRPARRGARAARARGAGEAPRRAGERPPPPGPYRRPQAADENSAIGYHVEAGPLVALDYGYPDNPLMVNKVRIPRDSGYSWMTDHGYTD